MRRFRLLDLFSSEGGAGAGYARAGFDVTGVDIKAQPLYPFEFVQADALEYLVQHGGEFDAIHASPPCPKFSTMLNIRRDGDELRAAHLDLLTPIRPLLEATGKPYIIENVSGAADVMLASVMLCGTMFGLPMLRHRLFESNVPIVAPRPCNHRGTVSGGEYVGIYSMGGAMKTDKGEKRKGSRDTQAWRDAMECQWMSRYGLTQAIPPAYTEWLGLQLITPLQPELTGFRKGTRDMAKKELPAHLRNADYYELLTAYFVAKDELAGYMRKSSGIDWKVIRDKTDEGDALIYALRPAHKKHLKRAGRDATDVPRNWVPGDAEKEWLEAERERRKAIAAGNAPTRYNRPTPTNGKRAAAADYSSTED